MGAGRELNESLWVGTSEGGDYSTLSGDETADVVVVGAGITGLTTARLLVEQGASVIVIDAGPVCAGATGFTTAKITSLHGLTYRRIADEFDEASARLFGEANEAAIVEIARLVELDGVECGFERRAHVAYTTEPATARLVEQEAEFAAQLGLPAAPASAVELPFDVAAAVRFENQAQFHPRAYSLGLAAAITAAGGRIFTHTRAHHVDAPARAVVTDHGTLRGTSLVVATHLPINEMGGYFARTEASRSYALAVSVDGDRPQDMYLGVDSPTRSLRTAGNHLIVGGEGHSVGDDHDTSEHYSNLESWAREHFPVTTVNYRWSAQDWASADGLPYIGRMAHHDRVYVATAFRKWGMTHGTIAGMLIRDLVAGRANPWQELYDASRVAPRQSLLRVVAENVNALKHFVGDRLHTFHGTDLDDLQPGAGAVARVNGELVAAFRNDDGSLIGVSAVCTHLGCLLTFNTAERSWDCPCHGSRFSINGTILEGPATRDLPVVEI